MPFVYLFVWRKNKESVYRKLDEWQMEDKILCINFSSDGEMMLVSMDKGRVAALDSETGELVCKYEGASQKEFVIRSNFGGAGQNFVISGSEGEWQANAYYT